MKKSKESSISSTGILKPLDHSKGHLAPNVVRNEASKVTSYVSVNVGILIPIK